MTPQHVATPAVQQRRSASQYSHTRGPEDVCNLVAYTVPTVQQKNKKSELNKQTKITTVIYIKKE